MQHGIDLVSSVYLSVLARDPTSWYLFCGGVTRKLVLLRSTACRGVGIESRLRDERDVQSIEGADPGRLLVFIPM